MTAQPVSLKIIFSPSFSSWRNKQFELLQLSVVVVSVGLSRVCCVARERVQLLLHLNYSC